MPFISRHYGKVFAKPTENKNGNNGQLEKVAIVPIPTSYQSGLTNEHENL
jgi:hypothetical protein